MPKDKLFQAHQQLMDSADPESEAVAALARENAGLAQSREAESSDTDDDPCAGEQAIVPLQAWVDRRFFLARA